MYVQSFALAHRLVTNGEFLEFISDGGYDRPSHWLADGWALVQAQSWRHPLYWSERLDTEFTLAGRRPIDAAEPVCHLSYYEADAYARWAGARLPTEAEWEVASRTQGPSGDFVENGRLHPSAATRRAAAAADAGLGVGMDSLALFALSRISSGRGRTR